MSLVLFKLVCANRHPLEAAGASGGYAEFALRGERSPEPALLNALEDPVYSEVSRLLRELTELQGRSDREHSDVLQDVFGVASDPAPDGTRFKIGRWPACPTCGTHAMYSWEPLRPYQGPVLTVTHTAWNAASKAEKLRRLSAAVKARV